MNPFRVIARWACVEDDPMRPPRFRTLWARWVMSGCPKPSEPWRSVESIKQEYGL